MKRKGLLLMTPIFMIIFIIVSYSIILLWADRFNRKDIINTFYENKESFEQVIAELQEESDLYFDDGYVFVVKDDKSEKLYLSDKATFNKYYNIYNLKESLSLKEISKTGENIGFFFESNIRKNAWIIYLVDENGWIKSGHSILYKKQLVDNWYYIESN